MNEFRKIILLAIAMLVASAACSGRFVPRDPLGKLNKKWADSKTYEVQKDVDIGNGKIVKKGTKVKIWIESDSFSIKVKAYDLKTTREKAMGKNIVFMYEGMFKNEEFDQGQFEKELLTILKEVPAPTTPPKKK